MNVFPVRLSMMLGFAVISLTVPAQQPVFSAPPGIDKHGPIINITLFAEVPASSSALPRARINHLKPAGDGSGRLFVNDLNGPLHVIANGKVSLYLDLRKEFEGRFTATPGHGTGFASIAFHPDFARNGRFYTAHSDFPRTAKADFVPPEGGWVALQGVVTEWIASDPRALVFAGTRRELMRVDLPHTIHGMQEIAFNSGAKPGTLDYGLLYICIGDGGTTLHANPENTHRLDSVLGTILRIDPLGKDSANAQYGVPKDNPWAGDNNPRTFGEIYAYGFRNPHRISWDHRGDGKVLVGEIGENNFEELNLLMPGRNYGWNRREGYSALNYKNSRALGRMLPLPADDAGFTYPVAMYDHREGAAIVGGFVYRGSEDPKLVGRYLFGDIMIGRLFALDAASLQPGKLATISEVRLLRDGKPTTMMELAENSGRVDLRFGVDEAENFYFLEKRYGRIYRLIAPPAEAK